jgi:tetratricopeptide (TPR) repeat protein
MSYQEEEKSRLRRQASRQAIALAMQGRWPEVVAANKTLLEQFPDDIDAYNRLGRAYMELGEYALAKEAYEKALKLDPYNIISQKNLNRLSLLGKEAGRAEPAAQKVEPQQFIKEVGKAGVVNLYRLAPPEVLAKMVTGAVVSLKVDGPNLVVENGQGEYLGIVEPKHGQRLIKLMDGGNQYSAAIVSSTEEAVTVIIRETYQAPSQAGRLSFPTKEVEAHWPNVGDRIIRRGLEYEESLTGEPSYTVIGAEEGEDTEVFLEESSESEEEEAEE